MIPLIKIRATYLKRYKSKVIFSYGLIPIAVIIGIIIYLVKKDSDDKFEMNDKQSFDYKYGDKYSLFKDSNFKSISYFLSNTSLVVNDENLGKKLIEYIEEKVQIKLKLYKNENELNNHSQNIILLDYNEKKDNYKFTYKEKLKKIKEHYLIITLKIAMRKQKMKNLLFVKSFLESNLLKWMKKLKSTKELKKSLKNNF